VGKRLPILLTARKRSLTAPCLFLINGSHVFLLANYPQARSGSSTQCAPTYFFAPFVTLCPVQSTGDEPLSPFGRYGAIDLLDMVKSVGGIVVCSQVHIRPLAMN
jgi:hypothetical protein